MTWYVLDLETTGLDPVDDLICEIGIIEVTQNLDEVDRLTMVVNGDGQWQKLANDTNPYVRDMHIRSDLAYQLQVPDPLITTVEADGVLQNFLSERSEPKNAILIGNTIGFDRSFIQQQLPSTWGWLSHRSIDVSSIRILAGAWAPHLEADRIKPLAMHRAIDDCVDSLNQLKYYRKTAFINQEMSF